MKLRAKKLAAEAQLRLEMAEAGKKLHAYQRQVELHAYLGVLEAGSKSSLELASSRANRLTTVGSMVLYDDMQGL